MTKCQILEKHFGGKWQFTGCGEWKSNDGRYVNNVANEVDEFDNPLPDSRKCCLWSGGTCHYFEWWQLEPRLILTLTPNTEMKGI